MKVNDGNPTQILSDNGFLNFSTGALASREEYGTADRCVGSIFEALRPGESIQLKEGYFVLNDDLDLVQDWQIA